MSGDIKVHERESNLDEKPTPGAGPDGQKCNVLK